MKKAENVGQLSKVELQAYRVRKTSASSCGSDARTEELQIRWKYEEEKLREAFLAKS